MKIFLISIAVMLSLSAFIILLLSFYSGKAIKRIVLNGIFGFLTLLIINLTSKFTGVYIPINWYSIVGIGVFSIPAVIGLLVLNVIFI